MPATNETGVTPLKILQILDRYTVTVGGVPDLSAFSEGEELMVVAIGREVPGTKSLLLVPKTRLHITAVATDYLVAESPTLQRQEESDGMSELARAVLGRTQTTTEYREPLPVKFPRFSGNPAVSGLREGDVVIKTKEFGELAAQLWVWRNHPSPDLPAFPDVGQHGQAETSG